MGQMVVTKQNIYQALDKLSSDGLVEVWQFIEFLNFKTRSKRSRRGVALVCNLVNL
jgi:hypothetical protein